MTRLLSSGGGWSPGHVWDGPAAETLDVWRLTLTPRVEDSLLLTGEERARAERLLDPEKGRTWAAARAALRRILSRYLEQAPAAIELVLGEHGKPALATAGPSFNLSHSADRALLAVAARGRLGVDIEQADAGRRLARLAQRFFSLAEREELRGLPPQELVTAFYRGWTRKEAYVKAHGTGLSFSSRRFTVSLGERPALLATEMPGDDPGSWQWADLAPFPGFFAAACWEGTGAERTIRRFAGD